jgi:tetratricopeptide (TPR) repeat protein
MRVGFGSLSCNCKKSCGIIAITLVLVVPTLVNGQAPPPSSADKGGSPAPAAQTKTPPPRKQPQAKTQVEYDAYQKIEAAADPKLKMDLVDKFVTDFPDSELRGAAYQQGLRGAQMTNDYEKALDYSRKTLQLYADDVLSLLVLSSWIPERVTENDPQREAKLTEATVAAKKLLEVVPTLQKPAGQTDEQWNTQLKELNGRSHASLGFIELLKKDYPGAEEEFEKAISQMPAEPTFCYRLGLAYTYEKKYDAAAWNLARSVALKGVSEKPAKDALESLFKAYGEDPAKAGEEDLVKLAGSQEKMPDDFSFVKFMESKLNPKPPSP